MTFSRFGSAALVLALALMQCCASDGSDTASPSSQLRRLVTLSRHGSRAPNPVVAQLCPHNAANLDAYHVPLEELTEVGMRQLVAVGEHVRAVYGDELEFLSPSLNGGSKHTHFEAYFRSDAATRCSQSATALGYGLYPDGTGPAGFPRQPVPVTMQLLENEHAFAAPKGPCKATLKADLATYAATRAPELMETYRATLTRVSELCGANLTNAEAIEGGEDSVLAIKDVADMFAFDRDEGLPPLKGLTEELSEDIEQLAFTNLMERYYSTERMITYWNGGFPKLLLAQLNEAADHAFPLASKPRYYSFHGHRELLHSLAMTLGWEFAFPGLPRALNMSALHPGTTMFFELHAVARSADQISSDGDVEEEYFVHTYMWSPQTERERVRLSKCSSEACPLAEFNHIFAKHVAHTGTWQHICHYRRDGDDSNVGPIAELSDDGDWLATPRGIVVVLAALLMLGIGFGVAQAVMRMRNFHRDGYTQL